MLIRKITDQEMLVRTITDQESYWSAKCSLCTSAAVLGPRSPPKSQSVNQKSISHPKKIVVHLCGGSGRPAQDVANLPSPKVNQSTKKSISQPKVNQKSLFSTDVTPW